MKLVCMGTPEFALPTFQKLHHSRHEVVGLVTVPDKSQGRGLKMQPSPVKRFAMERALPVAQPERLDDPQFLEWLARCTADAFVVVAFRILPQAVFSMPRFGTVNLHASLLPKYRGAAPINWALIRGECETGVTTFFIRQKVDTGNIIAQRVTPIQRDDDAGSLHEKLAAIGADLMLESIDAIEENRISTQMQDDALATNAPKLTPALCRLHWNRSASDLRNQIRGLSPHPGAWTLIDEKQIKIFRAEITTASSAQPGQIHFTDRRLCISTNDVMLEILELQLAGRKRMSAEEFLRGFRFPVNAFAS